MVTASELARPEFALHWHEAVAIVSETTALLLERGITTVPDPTSVVLTPDGTLHLLNEGTPSAMPTQRLGVMLDAMLSSSPCPPELRRLVDETISDPPAFATIEAFADALAFFERPGREELLAALAARASEVELEERAHTELERLEARARNQPRRPEPRPGETPPRKHAPAVYAVAGTLMLVGAVAGALLGLRATGSTSAAATLTERVKTRVDLLAQRGLEAVGLRIPEAPSPVSPAIDTPPRVAPKPSRRTAKRDLTVTISVKELVTAISPLPPSVRPEAPAPLVRDEAVYAPGARDVEPAVLMRPQMPSRSPSTETLEEIGVLEIIVSATGAVEQVRLISASNRFQDRMIVSAAKAWQFEPAMKNGQPVRYRTRIRITL
jgi:TonB family protein